MEQIYVVYNGIDVVFGGGLRHLLPRCSTVRGCDNGVRGGVRDDCENLRDALSERGFQFIGNVTEMRNLQCGKAWGLFGAYNLQPDIDRPYFAPTDPTLPEMTSKAIELLSSDPKTGFMLVVEGSQIDFAGHNHDPMYTVTDFIAFGDAVKKAVDFAKKKGNTIVLVFPDHNTGGMSIGNYQHDGNPQAEKKQEYGFYTDTTIKELVGRLHGMSMTSSGLVKKKGWNHSARNIVSVVQVYWNLTITEDDALDALNYKTVYSTGLGTAIAHIVTERYIPIGYTTHGHTGETVPLWMYGVLLPAA